MESPLSQVLNLNGDLPSAIFRGVGQQDKQCTVLSVGEKPGPGPGKPLTHTLKDTHERLQIT